MTVDYALVHDKFAVYVLALDGLAVTVKLVHMALCSKGDEHGKRTEIVDVMVYGSDAELAEVGYYHGAVEGADVEQRFGQQTEVVSEP